MIISYQKVANGSRIFRRRQILLRSQQIDSRKQKDGNKLRIGQGQALGFLIVFSAVFLLPNGCQQPSILLGSYNSQFRGYKLLGHSYQYMLSCLKGIHVYRTIVPQPRGRMRGIVHSIVQRIYIYMYVKMIISTCSLLIMTENLSPTTSRHLS